MMVSVHALLGAALSRLCRGPRQAFLLGLASHLVADLTPHRDLDIVREGILLAGALGAIGLVHGARSREFAGALGGLLPDTESAVAVLLDLPDETLVLPNHSLCHGPLRGDMRGQTLLAAACLAVLALPSCEPAPGCGTPSA
jgi:hypothetical protein